MPGEIYLGGAGVTRGYHQRPDSTAERYLPDPFGARLYRSGDLARWRPDGAVEFLGRVDNQVKIRGFRIELGEIEARLLRHPQVKAAAVIVRLDPPGEQRVVAYVVPDETLSQAKAPPDAKQLREFLKASLPDYMLPSAFVFLEQLPATLTGKLDRQALPAPDSGGALDYQAPGNPLEAQLAQIWAELLGVPQVGIHDNFFELGGHSLSAVQVIVRLQERLGLEASVAELFDAPTIAQLAPLLVQQQLAQWDDAEVAALLSELE